MLQTVVLNRVDLILDFSHERRQIFNILKVNGVQKQMRLGEGGEASRPSRNAAVRVKSAASIERLYCNSLSEYFYDDVNASI